MGGCYQNCKSRQYMIMNMFGKVCNYKKFQKLFLIRERENISLSWKVLKDKTIIFHFKSIPGDNAPPLPSNIVDLEYRYAMLHSARIYSTDLTKI